MNDMMDKTVNVSNHKQGDGKMLAYYCHTVPCCLSKPGSSLEAGKKQPRVWLEYACGATKVLLRSSFGAPLVLLWSPFSITDDTHHIHGGNTEVSRMMYATSTETSRRCNGDQTEMSRRSDGDLRFRQRIFK